MNNELRQQFRELKKRAASKRPRNGIDYNRSSFTIWEVAMESGIKGSRIFNFWCGGTVRLSDEEETKVRKALEVLSARG